MLRSVCNLLSTVPLSRSYWTVDLNPFLCDIDGSRGSGLRAHSMNMTRRLWPTGLHESNLVDIRSCESAAASQMEVSIPARNL